MASSGKNSGFTLLESSIVITVVGLVVGVLFVGATIIRNAELQSMIGDADVYMKSVQAFRDKYSELPGDYSRAEDLWGSDTGCPFTSATTIKHPKTCNGNGNTHIGDIFSGATTNYELFRVWQQLSNAQLIKASVTGVTGAGGNKDMKPDMNIPAAAVKGGGFSIYFIPPQDFAADTTYFPADYSHVLLLGGYLAADLNKAPLLTPEDAAAIDRKMDDGLPASGVILSLKSGATPNCSTTDDPATAVYNTAYKDAACASLFITGY